MTLRYDTRTGKPVGLDWDVITVEHDPGKWSALPSAPKKNSNPVADLIRKGSVGRPRRIQPDTEAEVIRLYNDGLTAREVGERFGIRANTVSKVLLRNDVQPRTKSEAAKLTKARRAAR